MEGVADLLRQLLERNQSLEESEMFRKLDARLCRLEVQLREQTVNPQQNLPSPMLEEKLGEISERLQHRIEQIEQLVTKLRSLKERLQDQTNNVKMILEQALSPPQVCSSPRIKEHQATPTTQDEEGGWAFRKEGVIECAVSRGERAVVYIDKTLEAYSSGKLVGRYSELNEVAAAYMCCSGEYVTAWLRNSRVACYRWLSERIEWLYCLHMKNRRWNRTEVTSNVLSNEDDLKDFCQERDLVIGLFKNRVTGWSLSQHRTTFIIKTPGAYGVHVTGSLLLVSVRDYGVEVFTEEGKKLYSIGGVESTFDLYFPPLASTNYTAIRTSTHPYHYYIWPTRHGQTLSKVQAYFSALHPYRPHLCSSVQGEPWRLVLRDVSTNLVIWERPQACTNIQVFSIDHEHLFIKPDYAPGQVLKWSSGELEATVPIVGSTWAASIQYIISSQQIFYRDLA